MNLETTVKKASQILKNHNVLSHELDAEIILSEIMGIKREYLIINDKKNISEKIAKKYYLAIKRRIKKEPVAYIIGKREFWSENFSVNSGTLIPRPESELLIYKVVDFFKNRKIDILDIGTGSGCILLSILKELKFSKGIGIDVSAKAIKIARKNSKKLDLLNRSKFKVFDMNEFNIGRYDLIVSNPPYIPTKDLKNLDKDIANYEPRVALNGGLDGLDLIKKVIYKSKHLIKKSGILAIEIGNDQYKKTSSFLKLCGFKEMSKVNDFNCNVRCIISTKIWNFKF